jgi:hypothetical protein
MRAVQSADFGRPQGLSYIFGINNQLDMVAAVGSLAVDVDEHAERFSHTRQSEFLSQGLNSIFAPEINSSGFRSFNRYGTAVEHAKSGLFYLRL